MTTDLWQGDVFIASPDNRAHTQRLFYVVKENTETSIVFSLFDATGNALTEPNGRFTTIQKVVVIAKEMLQSKYVAVRTRQVGLSDEAHRLPRDLRQALASIPLWRI